MKPYQLFLTHLFKDLDVGVYPFRLSVETTNHCNLRCTICPRESSDRGYGHIDFELFESIARQSAGHEVIFYPQGFGETFIHPRIRDMLKLLNESGVRCVDVITNATYLDETNCHAIIDASTTAVTVSIDGGTKEVFEKVRPGADFDTVVANVERLFRLREERKALYPFILISVVALPEVKETLDLMHAQWDPYLRETDEIFVCSAVSWAGSMMEIPGAGSTKREGKRGPCRMLYKTLQVYYDGRATPCCYDHRCELEVGNANEESIQDIWSGERLNALRRLHEEGRFAEIPLCSNCPDHMD